jgi:ATP-binding cassette subfamily F protein uup
VLLISHDRDFLDRLVSGVIVPEGDGRWTEYAGGYSDMLAQRRSDLTRAPAKSEDRKEELPKAAKATASGGATPAKQRMTFKDKHALETLPKTIAGLQAKADLLQGKLADPQFYNKDRAGFEKATSDLGETQRKLAAAEEQWLELEIMREELAGN